MKRTLVQYKILKVLIPLVSATLLIMMIVSYKTDYNSQQEFFEHSMEKLNDKSANEVQSKIENQRTTLQWIATDERFSNMDTSEYAYQLNFYASNNTQYSSNLYVVYPDGSYYVSGKGWQNQKVNDRKYYNDIFVQHKDFSISSPELSRSTGIKKYTLAVPIKKGNEVVGILCGNVNLSILKDIVESCKFGQNGLTYIVDEKATLIGTIYDELVMTFNIITDGAKAYPGLEKIGQEVTRGNESKGYAGDIQNNTHFYAISRKIEGTPGWFIISCVPDDEFKSTAIKNFRITLIFLVITLIVIALAIRYCLKRMLTKPLKQLSSAIINITEGNLRNHIDYTSNDEIGLMCDNIREMNHKLHNLVAVIKEGADSLAANSEQVNATSQQVMEGSLSQNESIEELTATMEEMTSNIEQNTNNARETNEVSQDACNKFNEVVKNINNLLNNNKNISEAITIVNEIAFQTNILALNAAVEAARAGDAGKGFAVVAKEVRSLAEKSKNAADSIVEMSQKGLKLSEEAHAVMQETIPKIENTRILVNEIASASLEQKISANQVNDLIIGINGTVKNNSSSSEMLAESANNLATQAENLKDVVSYFKD